ncbi:MAG TPA: NrdH-redoxin [Candidatus Wolfebacteria bacterium]|nr:NrdH-redoxin [Candidatus Wolfebacteria bacterium]
MVKIYTTSTCPYCDMVKEFFKKNDVEYEELDVTNDEKARQEMIDKSHQMGVPVLDINGTIIVGFNRPELEKALGIK